MTTPMWYLTVWLVVNGGIGAAIGTPKGRRFDGFLLGGLLGFVGWIIIAVLQPTRDERARRQHEAAQTAALAARYYQPQPGLVPSYVMAPEPGPSASSHRPCPWCAEPIRPAAVLCRFCGRDVPAVTEPSSAACLAPASLPSPAVGDQRGSRAIAATMGAPVEDTEKSYIGLTILTTTMTLAVVGIAIYWVAQ